MYRYYCIMRPPMIGGLPHSRTLQDAMCFDERRYIPEIDRMAWGWIEYDQPITPDEINDYELVEGKSNALAYIQQLEAAQPHWISVDERLPEDDKEVLVYAVGNDDTESTIALTCYTHRMYGYNIKGWAAPWQYFNTNYKITHWMPLPQPPKEEENRKAYCKERIHHED